MAKNLVYDIHDKPKFGQMIVFAIQQLLAIMAATLVVPVIIGHGMSPVAALFGAGVGTLVYLCFTKFRSPVFLGSSFAFINSMVAAFAGAVSSAAGYAGIILGATLAGLVYVIIAIVVKFAGVPTFNSGSVKVNRYRNIGFAFWCWKPFKEIVVLCDRHRFVKGHSVNVSSFEYSIPYAAVIWVKFVRLGLYGLSVSSVD